MRPVAQVEVGDTEAGHLLGLLHAGGVDRSSSSMRRSRSMSTLDPIMRTMRPSTVHGMGLAAHPVRRAVRPQQAVLAAERLARARAHAAPRRSRARSSGWTMSSTAGVGIVICAGGQPAKRRGARRVGDRARVQVDVPEADAAGLFGQREARRGVGQVLDAALLVVDVDERADHEDDGRRSPWTRGSAGAARSTSRRDTEAEVDLALGAVAERLLEHAADVGQIVGMDEPARSSGSSTPRPRAGRAGAPPPPTGGLGWRPDRAPTRRTAPTPRPARARAGRRHTAVARAAPAGWPCEGAAWSRPSLPRRHGEQGQEAVERAHHVGNRRRRRVP